MLKGECDNKNINDRNSTKRSVEALLKTFENAISRR